MFHEKISMNNLNILFFSASCHYERYGRLRYPTVFIIKFHRNFCHFFFLPFFLNFVHMNALICKFHWNKWLQITPFLKYSKSLFIWFDVWHFCVCIGNTNWFLRITICRPCHVVVTDKIVQLNSYMKKFQNIKNIRTK